MMDEQVITDAEFQALLKRFGAPLAKYAASSSAREENANFVARTLLMAMIGGPEMEEETWKSFREIAHMPEEALNAIQDFYNHQMKRVVSPEQLTALKHRYGLRRKPSP